MFQLVVECPHCEKEAKAGFDVVDVSFKESYENYCNNCNKHFLVTSLIEVSEIDE